MTAENRLRSGFSASARSYFRFPSRDYWLRAHAVHVDDISEYDPKYSMVSSQWLAIAEKSTLRNLKPYDPTFGIHGDTTVYLIAKVKPEDHKSWIVGVDIEKKMLRLIQPYTYSEGGYALPAVLPSTFSYYLNTQLQVVFHPQRQTTLRMPSMMQQQVTCFLPHYE